jgi:hypothetical protein
MDGILQSRDAIFLFTGVMQGGLHCGGGLAVVNPYLTAVTFSAWKFLCNA